MPGMTFVFTKGGVDSTKLMNVVNLPMQSSAVVRKMTQAAVPKPTATDNDKGTKLSEVNLLIKHALSSVDGLDIKLKNKELAKLGVQPNPAADGPGETAAGNDDKDPPSDPATSASDKNEPPARKARKHEKKVMFRGYDEEKPKYKTVVHAISRGSGNVSSINTSESRPITALDDCLAACRFILDKLMSKGSVKAPDEPGVLASYSFCVGLFLEFAWTGKVAVNGKHFRQYSVLRTELQQCFLDAHELLLASADEGSRPPGAEIPKPGSKSKQKTRRLSRTGGDALHLVPFAARHLHGLVGRRTGGEHCAEHSQGHDGALRGGRQDEGLRPETMALPLVMHPSVQTALQAIARLPSNSEGSLTDILSVAHEAIVTNFPSLWTSFGFDCVSAQADQGQFVEDTATVFRDVDKLSSLPASGFAIF